MKIGTDFGQDNLRRHRAHSWNIGEINARDAIELPSKAEARIVALTLKGRMLGAPWNFLFGFYGTGQSLHETLDLAIQFFDQLLAIAVAIQ